MKIALATTLALAAAKEKKVPPRHPNNRLNKLGIFYNNFFAEMVEKDYMKQGQADRYSKRMNDFLAKMGEAFDRETCGYYDDTSKHGGPDPNPEVNSKGKPRNRRDEDGIHAEDLAEATAEWCADQMANNYFINGAYTELSDAHWAECCHFDNAFCNGKAPRSGAKANKSYDRLSDLPELKWKQITTGTRKWAQRYINNCAGMRKHNLAVKRANKVYNRFNQKFF